MIVEIIKNNEIIKTFDTDNNRSDNELLEFLKSISEEELLKCEIVPLPGITIGHIGTLFDSEGLFIKKNIIYLK